MYAKITLGQQMWTQAVFVCNLIVINMENGHSYNVVYVPFVVSGIRSLAARQSIPCDQYFKDIIYHKDHMVVTTTNSFILMSSTLNRNVY